MNNSEVIADFRRRWEGTFVWLEMEERKKEVLVKISRVEESASKIGVLHLDSDEFGAITLNLGSEGHNIKFKYPPVGVFQYKRDAFMFQRRPLRQYRRGICSDNSTMYNITRQIMGNYSRWSLAEVQAAFAHKTSTLSEALDRLQHDCRSVALPGNYSLCSSFTKDPSHILFHWYNPVARLNDKGDVTVVLEDGYKKILENLNDHLESV